jgi:hypothetical protein
MPPASDGVEEAAEVDAEAGAAGAGAAAEAGRGVSHAPH